MPFILASLGYVLIAFAWTMPLLEWQISDIVTDIPSTHEGNIRPSWTTKFGEALLDGPRFGSGDVSVVRSAAPFSDNCGNVDLVIHRSQHDEKVEQRWLTASDFFEGYQSIGGWAVMILAAICIWLFATSHEHRPAGSLIILTIIAATFGCILLMIWYSAYSVTHPHYNLAYDCRGAVTLTATLSKTYFGPLAALFAGVCLQAGAIVLISKTALSKRGISA
ncbi:MAG: hypothetical protein ACM33V_01875 [Chloroflexota bacterium]|nr:hypothetical protein [Anaerolineales bacterium]